MFDVWKNILAEIEQKIPDTQYATWFVNANLVDVSDGIVRIGAPNIFTQKQLKAKYDDIIRRALKNQGISFSQVEYIVQSSKTRNKGGRESIKIDKTETMAKVESTRRYNKFDTGLNPRYTLDNFVVGTNNDLAVSAARNVVENPGQRFNPFFLYSGPGLGKTHLVQAIGNELLRRNPRLKILYKPINHFYTEFIESLKKKGTDAFREKYQKLDVLIIDDFQFIIGKEKSQEEFFNIFNDLHQANKQIIVTSDRLPSQIKTLDERLSSRLAWSGPIDMQMPSFEDRCAILQTKAEISGVEIEREAIEYIAENVKTNIRDLEGEFSRVMAVAELKNMSPLELINEGYVNTSSRIRRRAVTPKKIVETTANHFSLSVEEMCGKSRISHIKTARQVAMYILSEELQMSTPKIALEVGVKDHTTVMHGIRKIKSDLKLDFALREHINDIKEQIYN